MRRAILLAVSVAVATLLAGGVALALPSETPDETLMVDGRVRTITQVGTNVWLGGKFTQVHQRDGTVVANVGNVAVFDSLTEEYVDIAPTLGGEGSEVWDMALYGDDVLIAGKFSGPTSSERNLVLVDGSSGQVIRWYNSPGLRSVLAVLQLGKVYGGGVSLSAFDVGSKKKLWSRATTTVDQSLRSHPLGAGYRDLELDADGSTIWAACACDAVDGNPAKALVKLDTEGAHDASWVAEAGRQAFGISVMNTPDKLYLGAGGSDFLAEYPKADSCGNLTDGLIDWCWQRDTSGSTQAVEVMDGQLVVGGHFWEVADQVGEQCGSRSSNPDTLDPNDVCQTRKRLAAYTFDGVLDPNWDPVYSGKFNLVWALHVEGERLHTGGEFTTVSGIKQTNYARLSVDNTPPTLSAVSPADGTTDVALDANVEATFSEAIDSSTLTNTTFTLTKQDGTPEGTQVPATLSYNSSTNTATLNPEADLSSRASYTATIKGGTEGVKDSSGNPLANDEVWSITTTLECTIVGTSSAETLTGTSADDVICAGGGNDTIKGLEGNDTIKGEGGADQLYGELGDDHLDGGLGTDTALFTGSLASINASLADGTATGEGSDTFSGIETIIGSNQPDVLTGSATNNTLNGAGGADSIVGLEGADTLKGAGGGDTLDSRDGVEGNDTLDGKAGTDTCMTDATEKSIVSCER